MDLKISVVVITYNRPGLLQETIQSILSQTFTNFELIIVDNFSNYDFFALVNNFNDNRIKAYQNLNNGIIATNRNYGINLARGEYIALCDDDDVWMPTKLADQMRIMERYPSVSLCSTAISYINVTVIKTKIRRIIIFVKDFLLGTNIIPAKYSLIFIPFIANSSVIFRKNVIESVGLINEDPELRSMEDFDYWFRISQNNGLYFLNKKLTLYRIHNQQMSIVDRTLISRRWEKVFSNHWHSLNALQKLMFKLNSKM